MLPAGAVTAPGYQDKKRTVFSAGLDHVQGCFAKSQEPVQQTLVLCSSQLLCAAFQWEGAAAGAAGGSPWAQCLLGSVISHGGTPRARSGCRSLPLTLSHVLLVFCPEGANQKRNLPPLPGIVCTIHLQQDGGQFTDSDWVRHTYKFRF